MRLKQLVGENLNSVTDGLTNGGQSDLYKSVSASDSALRTHTLDFPFIAKGIFQFIFYCFQHLWRWVTRKKRRKRRRLRRLLQQNVPLPPVAPPLPVPPPSPLRPPSPPTDLPMTKDRLTWWDDVPRVMMDLISIFIYIEWNIIIMLLYFFRVLHYFNEGYPVTVPFVKKTAETIKYCVLNHI